MKIWIGYDDQFKGNLSSLVESISRYNPDCHINMLHLLALEQLLTRPRDPNQSTDSAFTRWLVPFLSGYQGWNLYIDSDVMFRADVSELEKLKDNTKAVMVVKHPRYKTSETKFNSHIQTDYERKNWSSVMLFNSELCKNLTVNYVNTASGLDLHQFKWVDDELIGELPKEWNHLVNISEENPNAKIVHWTLGGPWFPEFKDVEFSEEWKLMR